MSRPRKCRKYCECHLPSGFKPCGCGCANFVLLERDEIEAIRLVDFAGNEQQQAADEMQISRTTLQRIYKSARHKIADAIINGREIKMSRGGE